MKLLVVTPKIDKDDENLGAFYYWFEEFAKRCEKVVVIADAVGNCAFPKNLTVYSLGKEKNRARFFRLWKFWELFSWHYARTDAVFFHMAPEFVIAASPFLISLKRISALWYAHKSVTLKLKLAERMVDFIFTSSGLGFRLPSKKVIYTGQAINTQRFAPNQELQISTFKVLKMVTVGRISPIKNQEIIIRACEILKNSLNKQWEFSIVGGPLLPKDEEYLLKLKKMVREKGLEGRVRFEGPRPFSEIPQLLNEYDIFVNMSSTGSLDKAVLEAMSSGLSTITSNEAYREILPPKYFLEHQSPQFLAERIKSLMDEPRPNMSLRSIAAENHGLEKTIDRIFHALENAEA
jgi:glycosyltransferase involved in cell wall biosynthesis